MASVHVSRLLDGAVMAIFLLFLSGGSLFMLAQLWTLSQNEMFQQWKIGHIVRSVFPFSKRFEFTLSHMLLFSIVICLLSLRSDSYAVDQVKKEKRRD